MKFVATGKEYYADEIGVLKLDMSPRDDFNTRKSHFKMIFLQEKVTSE